MNKMEFERFRIVSNRSLCPVENELGDLIHKSTSK